MQVKYAQAQVSIWSSFDSMVDEAESYFFNFNFSKALQLWNEYAKITGASGWNQNFQQLRLLTNEFSKIDLSNPENIFNQWLSIRQLFRERKASVYTFNLMQKLYAIIFLRTKLTVSFDLATGIFCFIDGRIDNAIENLKMTLNHKPDSFLARVYMSKCLYNKEDEEAGLGYLTQAMFMGGNEFIDEDIESERIRNLYSRLRGLHGQGDTGVWLAPFEAWIRNIINITEDMQFFLVMQMKERNERILQVKYYVSEKYRHFIRCLYISEYVRNFLQKEKGIIWEQEAYMEKLDSNLFERYRKKRKPIE